MKERKKRTRDEKEERNKRQKSQQNINRMQNEREKKSFCEKGDNVNRKNEIFWYLKDPKRIKKKKETVIIQETTICSLVEIWITLTQIKWRQSSYSYECNTSKLYFIF